MYKIGDEVIEKSTGRKGRIVSMAEMAGMCYEISFPGGDNKVLRFAREITPANTVCTGQVAVASALPLFATLETDTAKVAGPKPAATCR